MPPLIIFDLDGTLAESKQAIGAEVAVLLTKVLDRTKVAIMSAGALPQFLKQVVEHLPTNANLSHLYLLPTSGASFYEYRAGNWTKIYEEQIPESDRVKIDEAMRLAAKETGLIDFSLPAHGERIEYRGGQMTLSALGQEAPLAEKKAWDPDKSKRRALQKALAARLPDFSVGMGGATSIDITKKGVSKEYGIHQLSKRLKIPESEMLYVGDELEAGGNDEVVYKTDIKARAVSSPADTATIIEELLGK